MDWLWDPQAWVALVTLTVLEIVLGVDNVIFISILAGKLPAAQQAPRAHARAAGWRCSCASVAALDSPGWSRLTAPLWSRCRRTRSPGRDLILLAGGLFLLARHA